MFLVCCRPGALLTLPFLSYGGSSLVVCAACTGVLLRIEQERRSLLGSEEVEFSEDDFFDESAVRELRHGR